MILRYSIGVKCAIVSTCLLALWSVAGGHSQVVSIGHDSRSLKEYCDDVEPLYPNLVLTRDTKITGRITDQTMEPFRNSAIQVRRFVSATKQVPAKKASTDDNGNFDLGTVKRGKYRLLLSPSRAFKQPEKLECWANKECSLNAVLIVNPTDQLTTNCPIR